jgi:hypothetical protein
VAIYFSSAIANLQLQAEPHIFESKPRIFESEPPIFDLAFGGFLAARWKGGWSQGGSKSSGVTKGASSLVTLLFA